MTTFVFALLLQVVPPQMPVPLPQPVVPLPQVVVPLPQPVVPEPLTATPPPQRSIYRIQDPYTFLDKREMPPLPAPNNRDEDFIAYTLRVIGQACKKSEVPGYTCSCVPTGSPFGGGLQALTIATDPGEPMFTRVVGFYAIAIAAKQGCRDDSLARAVLIGLQTEPQVDICINTFIGVQTLIIGGRTGAGGVTEMPCTVFDDGRNVVEAAVVAAVYFGPPGTIFESGSAGAWRQFKTALENIAADTDEKRHGATIAAAKEALHHLDMMKENGVTK
jgi:hypothetical protein